MAPPVLGNHRDSAIRHEQQGRGYVTTRQVPVYNLCSDVFLIILYYYANACWNKYIVIVFDAYIKYVHRCKYPSELGSHAFWKTLKITNSFTRSWKCPWILQNQEMSWKQYCLWKQNPLWTNKYYACRRKKYRYIVVISHVSQNLNKSGWIKQLDGVRRRRLYPKNVNNRSYIK